jgi:hypothetical protein
VGDEHLCVIADDGLRNDDRTSCCVCEPAVDVDQPLVRQTDADFRKAPLRPGRIGSAVTDRASTADASTALVEGRSTAAVMDRVATSTKAVNSTRAVTASSSRTNTSSGVESICITSPGAVTLTWENAPSGRAASVWQARSVPVVRCPRDSRSKSRQSVRSDPTPAEVSGSWRNRRVPQMMGPAVRVEAFFASAIAMLIAATTCGSPRDPGPCR